MHNCHTVHETENILSWLACFVKWTLRSICTCKALLIFNVLLKIPNLPMHNLTFYSLKISPKNCPQLILGPRTEIKKKVQDNFFM